MARRLPTPPAPVVLPLDVRVMNLASTLVYGLALLTLLAAGVLWLTRAPWFAYRAVQLDGDLTRNSVNTIRANAMPQLSGNFFSLDLQRARLAFEAVPWVRQAVVRRVWPDRLAVQLQEHQAVALWHAEDGEAQLVNSFGEAFEANLGDVEDQDLPTFEGPADASAPMWAMYQRLQPLLQQQQIEVRKLALSGRGSWRVETEDGAQIELGRGSAAEVLARVERFTRTLAQVSAQYGRPLLHADLRHTDGYAVRLQGVTTVPTPATGKAN